MRTDPSLDGVGDFEECAITRIFIGQMVDICYEFSVHVCEFVMQIEDRVDERNSGVGPPDLSIFDSQAPMCINFVKCASGLSNQHSVDHSALVCDGHHKGAYDIFRYIFTYNHDPS